MPAIRSAAPAGRSCPSRWRIPRRPRGVQAEIWQQQVVQTIVALGEGGAALLTARWPEIQKDPTMLASAYATLAISGWMVEPALNQALDVLRAPAKQRSPFFQHNLGTLAIWFATLDAAADPGIAATLVENFPQEWVLFPSFSRHLKPEALLAWTERCAMSASDLRNFHYLLSTWQSVGAPALPVMERVAAAREKEARGQIFAKRIQQLIASLKSPK